MTDVASIYHKELEEEMIARLADEKGLSLDQAMDVFYRSRLARQISDGLYGIQYLSASYLVSDLIANEPDLFVTPAK